MKCSVNGWGKKNIDRRKIGTYYEVLSVAGVAQLVERLTCNQQVGGSTPFASSIHEGFFYGGAGFGAETRAWGFGLSGEVPKWPKGADCKSAGSCLRRFKSFPPHQSGKEAQRGVRE